MASDGKANNCRNNVVVTGFGLFRDHRLNPSWEAIKDGQLNIDLPNVNVITRLVDVSYDEVDRVVDELWKEYNPILMVHVGLAAFETSIRIEQVARHGPYIHDDVKKNAPHRELRDYNTQESEHAIKYTCKPCNFPSSQTCFDVERICEKLNKLYDQGTLSIPFKKSDDAGLYVCEYIYLKSLSVCDKAVFIHVPDVEKFTLEEIRRALGSAIKLLIEELNQLE